MAQYRQDNKEKIDQTRSRYLSENKERVTAYQKSWAASHKEEIAKKRAAYKMANKERIREAGKAYREENKHIISLKAQARANLAEKELEACPLKIRQEMEMALNIESPEDWYNFTRTQITKELPLPLRGYFQVLSRDRVLELLYPEENWVKGKFCFSSNDTWKNPEHVRDFLKTIEPRLGIREMDDWYRVSKKQILEAGAVRVLSAFGSIYSLLKFAYPNFPWNEDELSKRKKKSTQWYLKVSMQSLLEERGNSDTGIENYLHPDLFWSGKRNIELDIWFQNLNLAVEYQGEQHYHDFAKAFGDSNSQPKYATRDHQKKSKCAERGIKLFVVPYWWDLGHESLQMLYEEMEGE
eukprot:TRINITY_DN842_c0_g1_i1.p1 TRINITY_DN842_c0_g1~~TRINITY_DN842_c0_g1_i1.p1  ORF type:complete len:410 (+),score=60.80 TRINITY_DN842_c0_g1_i1:172-1230(+)